MFSFVTEQFTEKEQRQIFFRRLFRRVFLEDWLLKLIALAITLALWLGVTGLRTPTQVRLKNVALTTRISNDMEITNSPVREVDIVVTGDKRRVDRLNPNDLVITVDLSDVKPGDRTVQLLPETVNLELPSGIKLDEIQPNKIAVRLEKVAEREVTVKPEIEGSVAEGFEIYSQMVAPLKVRVRGAESFVKSLDSISTEKINVDNQRENFTVRQVGLNVTNPNVTVLDGIVDVVFRVGEKRVERVFVIPVETESGIKRLNVLLFGPRSVIENVQVDNLQIQFTKSETGETVPQVILSPELQDKVEVRRARLS
jgi:YbbR domain-containing protein